MPRISRTVQTQPTTATATRAATRPRRALAAAYAGARPPAARSPVDVIGLLRRPGELRLGQSGPALVGDPERADAGPLGLGHREVGAHRVEHALEAHRLARLHAERDDVLDLEVDRVADADAVLQAVVAEGDRGALHAEHLADERGQGAHRTAE